MKVLSVGALCCLRGLLIELNLTERPRTCTTHRKEPRRSPDLAAVATEKCQINHSPSWSNLILIVGHSGSFREKNTSQLTMRDSRFRNRRPFACRLRHFAHYEEQK